MDDLADREWRVIPEEPRPGPMQMALDEIAAETAGAGGPRTVRVYRWEPSCLSLGYRQAADTVDWDYCESAGVDVTRRQTGGGGIYHDAVGDISYSIVAPKSELPGDLMDCYHLLCEPILAAIRRMGVPARFVDSELPALYDPACYLRALHPAHDVVVPDSSEADEDDESDGRVRKLAGNAQYRRKDAVIQHGSITYSVRPEAHLGVFADPGVDPAGFRERVTGVDEHADCSRAAAVDVLTETLTEWADAEVGGWSEEEVSRARERVETKYDDEEWVRERRRT
ncbi:lipoate--protein ligase family protein [Salinirubrum litoreum]|uniref:Biotin/lipoate A/B protein ligase family protein n=1 Tax=Salinirubrum litoreum TaxID=1126234 RepID=A0ABD5R6E2_9EURY|nr:biotin/lipoate A/B protein ligase family protein [Salinirubrum litoreum]